MAFGIESFTTGVPDSLCGGDDRLCDNEDLDCGETKPGPVIMSCFSTTILLPSFVVSNIMSPARFDFPEKGKGTSLQKRKKNGGYVNRKQYHLYII